MTPSRSVYGAFSVPAEEGEYAPERVTFAPPFPALIGYNAADYTVRTVGVTVIAPDASAPPVLDVWLLDPDADPAEDASWTLWPGAIIRARVGGRVLLGTHVGVQLRARSCGTRARLAVRARFLEDFPPSCS